LISMPKLESKLPDVSYSDPGVELKKMARE
jgi:hypothetical protein